MGDIAVSNVTVRCVNESMVRMSPRGKMNVVAITFGNASLTVPSGGIPLPAKGFFGMNKTLGVLFVVEGHGPYQFAYDSANHKLLVYHADYDAVADGALVHATSLAIAAQSLIAIAIGE